MMRVGIVGAGITGLSLTHYLARQDIDVVTVESSSQPGGAIRSSRVDGRLLEFGPQRIRLTPEIRGFIDELDLNDELLVADDTLPLYVYVRGELREVPRTLRGFIETDILTWRGKIRLFAEPLTAPASETERAGRIFQRKFGYEAYRNIIEPLFGGIYGSDPAVMPAKYSLARLIDLEKRSGSFMRMGLKRLVGSTETPSPISFVDGIQMLPRALYRAHEPYVHLDTPVDSISDTGRDGYVMETGSRSIEVDHVVLTTPPAVTAAVLDGVDGATISPLRRLTYNSLALVYLHASTDVDGYGYQVRRDEPLETLGVTWNDSLFDRDGVYTAFLGGMHDPGVVDRPDDELANVARTEFETVMGTDADVIAVRKLPRAFPAHDVTWKYLESVELPEEITLATNYTSRIGVPSRVRESKTIASQLSERD
ncbi:MAG: protoporphyrinogen oxidase [Natronomonas sp.]